MCDLLCLPVRNTKINATDNLTNIYCVKFIVLGPLRNTKWIQHEICPVGTYSLPGDIRRRNKIEGLRALKEVQKQRSKSSQEKLILAQKIMENFIKMKFMFHMTCK